MAASRRRICSWRVSAYDDGDASICLHYILSSSVAIPSRSARMQRWNVWVTVQCNSQDLDRLVSIRLGTAALAFEDDDETELVMQSASYLSL